MSDHPSHHTDSKSDPGHSDDVHRQSHSSHTEQPLSSHDPDSQKGSSSKQPGWPLGRIPSLILAIVIGGAVLIGGAFIFASQNQETFPQPVQHVIQQVSQQIETLNPANQADEEEEPDVFHIAESSPRPFQNNFTLVGRPMVVFSEKLSISEEEVSSYISITPEVPGTWRMEDNKQVIYLQPNDTTPTEKGLTSVLQPGTLYTLTVASSLPSQTGETLQEESVIRFRTQNAQNFGYVLERKLVSTQPGKPTQIEFRRSGIPTGQTEPTSFQVSLYQATEEQLLRFFSHQNEDQFDSSYLYAFREIEGEPDQTMDVQVENGQNISYVDIPQISRPGLYYVTIQNDNGQEDLFIANSDYAVQVFADTADMHAWSVNAINGSPLNAVQLTGYNLYKEPEEVFQAQTGGNGLLQEELADEHTDIIVGKKGNQMVVVDVEGMTNTIRDQYNVFSVSDRPIYRPGDMVHYKAVVRRITKDGLTVPQDLPLAVHLNTGDVGVPEYTEVKTDKFGTVHADFIIPPSKTDGILQVELSEKRQQTAEKEEQSYASIDVLPLDVKPYATPDLDISAAFVQEEYISKDTAKVLITAKTLHGTTFGNVPFRYRILANPYEEQKDRTLDYVERVARSYGGGETISSGESSFNKKGQAEIEFSTDLSAYEKSQVITVEITPDIGASPSVAQNTVLVHRGKYALFPEGIVADTTQGIRGSVLSLDHQNPRKPAPEKDVSITLRVYENGQPGAQVAETQSTTNENGTGSFNFDVTTKGTYELLFQTTDDIDNVITTRQTVYVGTEPTGGYQAQETPFQIEIPDKVYEAGEQVPVAVTSDQSDLSILYVTTAGGRVIDRSVGTVQSPPTVSVPDAPINQMYVIGFAAWNGELYSHYDFIQLDTEQYKVRTEVSFDPVVAEPGADVTATIQTTDFQGKGVAADTALTLVDKSVLQMTNPGSDIINSMYGKTQWMGLRRYKSTTGIRNRTEAPGAGGGCFLEGTRIRMADGTLKNIEEIVIGSSILTRESEAESRMVPADVTHTVQHTVDEYLEINSTLRLTPEHRIFVNNQWMTAGEAQVGDYLLDELGEPVQIKRIDRHVGVFSVYNLTTEPQHTFFAEGLYVHNEKGFTRTQFADTAYWNPSVRTNSQGKATVSITLPDNMTTFAARAYANTQDSQFGQGVQSLVSRRPVAIIPALASYYFQGDKPVLSALVQNSSGEAIQGTLAISISDIGVNHEQSVQIASDDYEEVQFPVELDSKQKELTYTFTFTDSAGEQRDGIELTQPLLPRGSLKSFWKTWEGDAQVELKSQFPETGIDRAYLSVMLHPGAQAKNITGQYRTSGLSIEGSRSTSEYVDIVSRIREGTIEPDVVPYAYTTNMVRYYTDVLLRAARDTDDGLVWDNGYSYEAEIQNRELIAWSANALQQVEETNIFDDMPSTQSVRQRAQAYALSSYETEADPEKKTYLDYLNAWVFGTTLPEGNLTYTYAIRVLRGEDVLDELINQAVPSAPDRLIWEDKHQDDISSYLATRAILERGSDEQAARAIRGRAITKTTYANVHESVLGVIHAARAGISLDHADVTLSRNDEVILDLDKRNAQRSLIYSSSYSYSDLPIQSSTTLTIQQTGSIPVYTTVSYLAYQTNDFLPASVPSDLIVSEQSLSRNYVSLSDNAQPQVGDSGAVVIQNPKNLSFDSRMIDLMSPGALFLDQKLGNSPQMTGRVEEYVRTQQGGDIENPRGYITYPHGYANQAVIFLPHHGPHETHYYVNTQYILNDGVYYQPKTILLYPELGIGYEEK